MLDLSLAACRKRQSPRTGFLHFFPADCEVSDTIPLFENFCFAFALFRQKTAEAILEGKELLERLLGFQSEEGNFPIFLHDYPRAWDRLMPLRIAPILLYILRDFGKYLPVSTSQRVERALSLALACAERSPPEDPLWKARLLACRGEKPSFEVPPRTAQEWWEWLLTAQVAAGRAFPFPLPYSKRLQVFLGEHEAQERGEPQPIAVEWLLAEEEGFGKRLLRDHPHQIYAALLFPINRSEDEERRPLLEAKGEGGDRLLWEGSSLHSLFLPRGKRVGDKILFKLENPPLFERGDLLEFVLYCDASSETELFVEGKKGTVFRLGEAIEIRTPSLSLSLQFQLEEGEGEFYGHMARGNRPSQVVGRRDLLREAYDWQIALRTLRRTSPCTLSLKWQQRSAVKGPEREI